MDQTYEEGDNASLLCGSTGGPNNAYQWQVNGSDIENETSQTLQLSNVNASTGGMYTCVVSNAAGSDSASTFLYVSPYFVIQPIHRQAESGSTVSLSCEAEAFPAPEYQWWHVNGEPIRCEIISDSQVLVFDPVEFGDEGDYYCNASSIGMTTQSTVVTLTGMASLSMCNQ